VLPAPSAADDVEEEPRTLRCRACGTMNLATEWYCEQCGGELAAL
jgi:Zn finger protein HypA/HybF involved in hydrogenase expression